MPDLSYINQFTYHLPKKYIANEPIEPRDASKLLLINRQTEETKDKKFFDIVDHLTKNDVLVFNQSKVFPARLFGQKENGKKVEVVLFQQEKKNIWRAITQPGLRLDMKIRFDNDVEARVVMGNKETGEVDLEFSFPHKNIFAAFEQIGQTPIPSYINTSLSEKMLREHYQTVYAKEIGSAAAPTAGLHFTENILEKLKRKGVQLEYVTLHVGLGTFQRLRQENFKTNQLHTEVYEVNKETAKRLNEAKRQKKRIIAIGTTTTRTLESITNEKGEIIPGQGMTNLFIYPEYKFHFVDSMITNFHLPHSSLLMLVSAFTSQPNTKQIFSNFQQSLIGKAYQQAIEKNYRFYSFGDAMWIYE